MKNKKAEYITKKDKILKKNIKWYIFIILIMGMFLGWTIFFIITLFIIK